MEESKPNLGANNQADLESLKAQFDNLNSQLNGPLGELKRHMDSVSISVADIDGYKENILKSKEESNLLFDDIKTIKNHIDEVKIQIDSVKDSSDKVKTEIDTTKVDLDSARHQVTSSKEQIDKFKSDADSHLKSIEAVRQSATEASEKIGKLLAELVDEMEDGEPSKMEALEDCYNSVLSKKEQIDTILKKIFEFETVIFGKNGEENGNNLRNRLSNFEIINNQKFEEWNKNYDTLFKKIEGLLPGATSTGLAKAYQDQGKNHQVPYWIWTGVFVLTTGGMIWFSIEHLRVPSTFQETFNGILSKVPFFVPAIWLAIFASKQQSKSKRLQEEYAYKETLSKSYESYKREVMSLPDSEEKQEMIEKLLQSMVEMMRYNPSETLQSNSHNDKPPIVGNLLQNFSSKKSKAKIETSAD